MTPRPWAVFVESNTTGHGEEMIEVARRLGLRPVLVSVDPSRYSFHEEVEIRLADTADLEAVLRAVAELDGGPVALLTTTSDRYVRIAARAAASLDLAGPDPAAVTACQDKGVQRERMADCGVSVPEHLVVADPDGARTAAERIGGSVVVKPVTGSGSVGVRLCCSPAEAAEHAGALLAEGTDERGNPRAPRVLVERAVPGREFSVEILAGVIVGVTETHLGSPPSFVEMGHDHPATLRRGETARLCAEAVGSLVALGLDRQTAHVELRMDGRDVWVIEVNPRLPGGRITSLVRLATGVDMLENQLRFLTGAGVNTQMTRHRAAAIRFLTADAGLRPPGGDDCLPVTGVVESQVQEIPAQRSGHGDFRDRIGYVIAVGDDTATAAARAETARTSGHFSPGRTP